MDRERLVIHEIESVIAELAGTSSSVKDAKMDELRTYMRDEDVEYVYRRLYAKADTASIYWLVKYLVAVGTVPAEKKLMDLALDKRQDVRDIVLNGILKMYEESLTTILFKVLETGSEKDVLFAVEKLGLISNPKVVGPIMNAYPRWRGNKEITVAVIRALGRVRDIRAVPFLGEFVLFPDNAIKTEAAYSLSVYSGVIGDKEIKIMIRSDNPFVKEVAILSLLKKKNRSSEREAACHLPEIGDEDSLVRILGSIKVLHSRDLARKVIEAALLSGGHRIKAAAEDVIMKCATPKVVRWLIERYRAGTMSEKATLLHILAGSGSGIALDRFLRSEYRNSSSLYIKLVMLDVYGEAVGEKGAGFLYDVVRSKDPEVMFSAAVSMCHVIGKGTMHIVEDIISSGEDKHSEILPVMLSYILNLRGAKISDTLRDNIFRFTASANFCVRYMAIRCMKKFSPDFSLERLFNMVSVEKDPVFRRAIVRTINHLLAENPTRQLSLFFTCAGRSCRYSTLFAIFRGLHLNKDDFFKAVDHILGLIEDASRQCGGGAMVSARYMVFLRGQVNKNIALAMDYISEKTPDDFRVRVLLDVLNSAGAGTIYDTDLAFLARIYDISTLPTKERLLYFMSITSGSDEALVDFLFKQMVLEKDKNLVGRIEKTLACFVARSLAGERP